MLQSHPGRVPVKRSEVTILFQLTPSHQASCLVNAASILSQCLLRGLAENLTVPRAAALVPTAVSLRNDTKVFHMSQRRRPSYLLYLLFHRIFSFFESWGAALLFFEAAPGAPSSAGRATPQAHQWCTTPKYSNELLREKDLQE